MVKNKYWKLEIEVQELCEKERLTKNEVINVFKKYEESNINKIKKLNKRRLIEYNRIRGGLKQTIDAHSVITKELIGSATKRIYGNLLANDELVSKTNFTPFIWGLIVGSLIVILLK
jgi:hypothetical protein